MFSSNDIKGLFFAFMVGGALLLGLSIFVSGAFGRRVGVSDLAHSGWWAIVLYVAMIVPKTNVMVYDKVTNRQMQISDVPKGVAVIAGALSEVEDGLEDIIRTAFTFPWTSSSDSFTDIYRVMVHGYSNLLPTTEIDEVNFKTYAVQCCANFAAQPGINLLTWDEVARMFDPRTQQKVDDWENIMRKCAVESVNVNMRDQSGNVYNVTCKDAFTNYISSSSANGFFHHLKDQTYLNEFCKSLGFDPSSPGSLNYCQEAIQDAGKMLGIDGTAPNILLADIVAAKKFKEAMLDADVITGTEMELSRQVNSFWAGSGMAADKYLGTIRSLVFSLIVLTFPLLAILMTAPGVGVNAAKYWLGSIIWVIFWGVIDYTILCYGVSLGYSSAFSIFRSSPAAVGFSLGILGVTRMPAEAMKAMIFMGNLRWMGAVLSAAMSYGIFRVGGYAFANIAMAVGSEAKAAGGSAGRTYMGGEAEDAGLKRATAFESEPVIKENWSNSPRLSRGLAWARANTDLRTSGTGEALMERVEAEGWGNVSSGYAAQSSLDLFNVASLGASGSGGPYSVRPEMGTVRSMGTALPDIMSKANLQSAVIRGVEKAAEETKQLVESYGEELRADIKTLFQQEKSLTESLSRTTGIDKNLLKTYTQTVQEEKRMLEALRNDFQKEFGLSREKADELTEKAWGYANVSSPKVLETLAKELGKFLPSFEARGELRGESSYKDTMKKLEKILNHERLERMRNIQEAEREAVAGITRYAESQGFKDLESAGKRFMATEGRIRDEVGTISQKLDELERLRTVAQAVKQNRISVDRDIRPLVALGLYHRYGSWEVVDEKIGLAVKGGPESPYYEALKEDIDLVAEEIGKGLAGEKSWLFDRIEDDLKKRGIDLRKVVKNLHEGVQDADTGKKIDEEFSGLRREYGRERASVEGYVSGGRVTKGERNKIRGRYQDGRGTYGTAKKSMKDRLEDFYRIWIERADRPETERWKDAGYAALGQDKLFDAKKEDAVSFSAFTQSRAIGLSSLAGRIATGARTVSFPELIHAASEAGLKAEDVGKTVTGLSALSFGGKSPRVLSASSPKALWKIEEYIKRSGDKYVAVVGREFGGVVLVRRDFLETYLRNPRDFTVTAGGKSYGAKDVHRIGESAFGFSTREDSSAFTGSTGEVKPAFGGSIRESRNVFGDLTEENRTASSGLSMESKTVFINDLARSASIKSPEAGRNTGKMIVGLSALSFGEKPKILPASSPEDFQKIGEYIKRNGGKYTAVVDRESGVAFMVKRDFLESYTGSPENFTVTARGKSYKAKDIERLTEAIFTENKVERILNENPPVHTFDLRDDVDRVKFNYYLSKSPERVWVDHRKNKGYYFSSPEVVKKLEEAVEE